MQLSCLLQRSALRAGERKVETTRTPTHGTQHLMSEIGMDAGASQQRPSQLRLNLAEKALCGNGARRNRGARLEYPQEPGVETLFLPATEIRAASIVLAERAAVVRQWRNERTVALRRLASGELGHEPVDEFQLRERRPPRVIGAPANFRSQPNRKCLGEVFSRVALRVPVLEVQHVIFTAWPNRIVAGVGRARTTENSLPVAPAPP